MIDLYDISTNDETRNARLYSSYGPPLIVHDSGHDT